MHTLKCAYCGIEFKNKSDKAKYCKPSHKTRASEQRTGKTPPAFVSAIKDKPIQAPSKAKKTRIGVNVPPVTQTYPQAVNVPPIAYYPSKTALCLFGGLIGATTGKWQWVLVGIGTGYVVSNVIEKQQTAERNVAKLMPHEIAITVSPVRQSTVIQRHDSPARSTRSIKFSDLEKLQFETLDIKPDLQKILGKPSKNFKALIYGMPGNGKTTFALKLGEYLANSFGAMLYNSSEEGFNHTLQNKIKMLAGKECYASNARNIGELYPLIEDAKYDFIVLDSLNDMKITPDQFKQLLSDYSDKSIIAIMQATKGGSYKGSSEYEHLVDMVIPVENYTAMSTGKNRFR